MTFLSSGRSENGSPRSCSAYALALELMTVPSVIGPRSGPSLLASAGVSAEVRMSIVGHSQLETHLGYTHADDKQMRSALESGLKSLALD